MLPRIRFLDTPHSSKDKWHVKFALAISLSIVIVFLGIILAAMFNGSLTPSLLVAVIAMAVAGIIISVAAVRSAASGETEKPKRDGVDMYTLIDRLVDDLDDDEAAYLDRKLNERDDNLRSNLVDSADDLLNRRASVQDS